MKKILMILALMLPMVLFSACEKEETTNNNHELIGLWRLYSSGDNEIEEFIEDVLFYQFNADYTASYWEEIDGIVEDKAYFSWSTDGDMLTLIFGDDKETSQYSIENNTLTIRYLDSDDSFTTFKRVE